MQDDYYNRTLEIKRRILEKPDLADRVRKLCNIEAHKESWISLANSWTGENFNPGGLVDSFISGGSNRNAYYVGSLNGNPLQSGRLHIALKRFVQESDIRHTGFDPGNLTSWQDECITGEAEYFERWRIVYFDRRYFAL